MAMREAHGTRFYIGLMIWAWLGLSHQTLVVAAKRAPKRSELRVLVQDLVEWSQFEFTKVLGKECAWPDKTQVAREKGLEVLARLKPLVGEDAVVDSLSATIREKQRPQLCDRQRVSVEHPGSNAIFGHEALTRVSILLGKVLGLLKREAIADSLSVLISGAGPVGLIDGMVLAREGQRVHISEARSPQVRVDASGAVDTTGSAFDRDQVIRLDRHTIHRLKVYFPELYIALFVGDGAPGVSWPRFPNIAGAQGVIPQLQSASTQQTIRLNVLQHALYERAKELGVTFSDCVKLVGLAKDDGGYRALVERNMDLRVCTDRGGQDALAARDFDILIVADGKNSRLRKCLEPFRKGVDCSPLQSQSLTDPTESGSSGAEGILAFIEPSSAFEHTNSTSDGVGMNADLGVACDRVVLENISGIATMPTACWKLDAASGARGEPRLLDGVHVYRAFHNYAYSPLGRTMPVHYIALGVHGIAGLDSEGKRKQLVKAQLELLYSKAENTKMVVGKTFQLRVNLQRATLSSAIAERKDKTKQFMLLEGDAAHTSNFLRASGLNTGLNSVFPRNPFYLRDEATDGHVQVFIRKPSLSELADELLRDKTLNVAQGLLERRDLARRYYGAFVMRSGENCVRFINSGGAEGYCLPGNLYDGEDAHASFLAFVVNHSPALRGRACEGLRRLFSLPTMHPDRIVLRRFGDTLLNSDFRRGLSQCGQSDSFFENLIAKVDSRLGESRWKP